MTAPYREDLAYIHDVGHGDFIRNAVPGLLDTFRQCGIDSGLVVDLGCGSGIWTEALVQAGYGALGVDISADIIDIARRRVPAAEFLHASLFDVALPSCAAVTSISECCNYLFDEKNNGETLLDLFRRVYSALQPGGVFVFDVIEPGRERGMPQRRWKEGSDWAVLIDAQEDSATQTLTRSIVSFRQVGELYRRDEEVHRLQLYKSADVARWLRQAGFSVRVVRGYGELRFTQAHAGFIARKPVR